MNLVVKSDFPHDSQVLSLPVFAVTVHTISFQFSGFLCNKCLCLSCISKYRIIVGLLSLIFTFAWPFHALN
jgi:hypothetical protein